MDYPLFVDELNLTLTHKPRHTTVLLGRNDMKFDCPFDVTQRMMILNDHLYP